MEATSDLSNLMASSGYVGLSLRISEMAVALVILSSLMGSMTLAG